MKAIQVRWTRHAGHCWRSRDKLISDVLLWTPTYGRAKAGWPARTYIQQLCEDTGCSPEDLPEAMNDREKWWEDIRASGKPWWWWLYIYIGWVGFVGYLMQKPVYSYISIKYIWFDINVYKILCVKIFPLYILNMHVTFKIWYHKYLYHERSSGSP